MVIPFHMYTFKFDFNDDNDFLIVIYYYLALVKSKIFYLTNFILNVGILRGEFKGRDNSKLLTCFRFSGLRRNLKKGIALHNRNCLFIKKYTCY